VDCPVCEKKDIYMPYIDSWSGLGNPGRLGPRVTNLPSEPFTVWTCPNCRYSNWFSKFEEGVKQETKKRILEELEAPVPGDKRSGWLPTWARYDLAARILEWDGASPRDRGTLLIAGAWAVRQDDTLWAVKHDDALAPRLWKALEAAQQWSTSVPVPAGEKLLSWLVRSEAEAAAAEQAAIEARAAGKPDPILDLVAAFLHRQLGESEAVTRILARMKDPTAPAAVREVAKAFAVSMTRERAFQELALPLLREEDPVLAVQPEARAWTRITCADTLRRLGRTTEATGLFLETAGDPEAPAWAVALVRHGLVKTGAEEEALGLLAAAETRAREALRKQLVDPQTADPAARLIGDLADATFFPDLLHALAHDSNEVRASALMALGRMGTLDLPPAAIEALGRLSRNKEVGDSIRDSALSILRREASPVSLPLFRAALDDDNHDIREQGVDALARCGEPQDVPRLLAFLERGKDAVEWYERRDALQALVSLANRDFSSAQDAATWWQSAKGRSRVDWVLEGFRAAGTEIAPPLSLESIPALLDLLDAGRERDQPWLTWNAHRILRDLTGQRFGWDCLTSVWSAKPPRIREKERPFWVEQWRAWWAAQQKAQQKPPK